MKIFSVEVRPTAPGTDPDIALVREGFSWPAFLLGPFWLLWHRMWWVFLGYVLVNIGLGALSWAFSLGDLHNSILTLAFSIVFAMHANDLRRWSLRRANYRFAGVVTGRNLRAAEQRLFDTWPPSSIHALVQ